MAVTSFMNDPLINPKFSRLELLDGILQMLREVNLFEPALIIVVEVEGLVDDPELLQESGHLNLGEEKENMSQAITKAPHKLAYFRFKRPDWNV